MSQVLGEEDVVVVVVEEVEVVEEVMVMIVMVVVSKILSFVIGFFAHQRKCFMFASFRKSCLKQIMPKFKSTNPQITPLFRRR